MEMHEFKPIGMPKKRSRWLWLAWFAVVLVVVFAFAFMINIPEWR